MKSWIKKMAAIGLSMTLALTAAGCSDTDGETVKKTVPEGEKVKVITVLQAQGDFVREVGKDHVDVSVFTPVGTNFWQWAPTLKEMGDLETTDVFVINGGGLEKRWYDQTYATVKLKNKDLVIVDPSKGLEELKLQRYYNPDASEEEKAKEHVDPFFYLDPVNAKHEVDLIAEGLSKKAPAYAEEFKKNADEFKKKLDELDKKYADTLSKVKRKEIVSPYPGYQYLAKRYGLKYYVPHSIATNDYPWDDVPKLKAIQEDFSKHDAKSIYFESEAAPRVGEFLASIGYKARVLHTYEGKLEGDNYKGYITIMEENLKALAEGLNE